MTRISFALSRRRLTSLSLLVVLGASLIGPAFASAATTPVDAVTLTGQEARMVSLLNADRAALGLVPIQVDSRLMALARARSADMIARNYFSHTLPDGRNVFDFLTSGKIAWYGAGEILAWNNYPMDVTASTANHQWLNSPGHKAIVVSTNFNYFGVGLAVDAATGKKMWTAVYIKGPDRTGARVTLATPTVSTGTTTTINKVTLAWSGADVRLQVLTAGLRSYVIQRKFDSGSWNPVTDTTGGSLSLAALVGHVHQFRIAAYDRAGNLGPWSTRIVDLR
ncbi:MAG TPA: CAP domain-containing protein [Candidatus Limnocylindrales bacterium]|nr:CAP domain-containing protein [Candidatus Limnocylindrales bacterium]